MKVKVPYLWLIQGKLDTTRLNLKIIKLLVEEGQEVPVNTPIAIIE